MSDENSKMSTEEVAEHANDKVDALIELLVKKKVITEEEFEKEFDGLFEWVAGFEMTTSESLKIAPRGFWLKMMKNLSHRWGVYKND